MDLFVVIKYFIVENELSESHDIGNTSQSILQYLFMNDNSIFSFNSKCISFIYSENYQFNLFFKR